MFKKTLFIFSISMFIVLSALLVADNVKAEAITSEIEVIFPTDDDGDMRRIGDTDSLVSWDYIDGATYQVDIDLYKGGVFIINLADNVSVTENDAIVGFDWQARYRVDYPETLELGRDYSIRVTDTDNPSIYGQGGDFFLIKSGDNTPPSDLINVSVSKKSLSDEDYKIKFEYTTPSEVDYYCINVYRLTPTTGIHDQVLDCVDKNAEPSTNSSYSLYEDSYVKEHSNGSLYYYLGAEDRDGNWTHNGMLNIYSWGDIGEPKSIEFISPGGGEEWQSGIKHPVSWTYKDTWYEFDLDLYKDGIFVKNLGTQYSFRPNDGVFEASYNAMEFPADLEVGSGYTIKGTDHWESSVIGESNEFSIIKADGDVTDECLPDGTLVKLPTDSKVYVIRNCKKEWIQSANEFSNRGYKWENVKETSSPVIKAYADYLEAKDDLLRAIGQERVYRIKDGKRLWVPTISAFNAQGLKWDDVEDADETTINQYPLAKLLRINGQSKVFYITNSGHKRHIPSAEVFNSYGNKWEDVVEVTDIELSAYHDNDLIKVENDPKVYKLENGKKKWIKTGEAFQKYGYKWDDIASINKIEMDSYDEDTPIE